MENQRTFVSLMYYINLLLDKLLMNVDVNFQDPESKQTGLHFAIRNNHAEVVRVSLCSKLCLIVSAAAA